jgi:hypothetical protein
MKLYRGCDLAPDGTGLVCRQARLGGLIAAIVFTLAFASFPLLVWWFHGPMIFVVVGGMLALLLLLFLVGDVKARFRDANWVLWIRPDRVCVNLLSYQDYAPLDSTSVVELMDRDLDQLQRHVEHYTVPDSDGGSVSYTLESLDIELRDTDTAALATAIAAVRRRQQPIRRLGFMSSQSGVTVYSVSLPAPHRLRITWKGGRGHSIRPRMKRVLDELASRVKIAEPNVNRRSDWSQLPDAEIDDQILAMVCAGNRLDAIKLLRCRRGYSITAAHRFVEELAEGKPEPVAARDASSAG